MTTQEIWLNANPDLSAHLRRANEARSAAIYAAFKSVAGSVAAPFRRIAERLRKARRARETYHALAGLNDHALRDIGLSRSEIRDVALGVGALPDGADATLAELRGIRPAAPAGHDTRVVPLPRADDRRVRPVRTAARAAKPASRLAAG